MTTPETFAPSLLIVIFGFIVWLMGYGIWRIALALMGAVYGFMIGTLFIAPDQGLSAIIIGVITAIVLGLLAYVLWSVVALIYGTFLGMGMGVWTALMFNAREGGQTMSVLVIIGAILGLVLAYFLKDQVIMLVTAFSGAGSILYGAQLILPDFSRLTTGDNYVIGFIIWIVVGIIGYSVQNSMFNSRLTGTYSGYRRRHAA